MAEETSEAPSGDLKTKTMLSLNGPAIFTLLGVVTSVVAGAFGLGVFTQKTSSDSALAAKDDTIRGVQAKLDLSTGAINALKYGLESEREQRGQFEIKGELLTRLVYFYQSHDATSQKLLTDVVCSMWKESEKQKITFNRGPIKVDLDSIASGLSPEIEKYLTSSGFPSYFIERLRRPKVPGSGSVGPLSRRERVPGFTLPESGNVAAERIWIEQDKEERQSATNNVLKQLNGFEVIKIVKLADGSVFEMPQEVAVAVHTNSNCSPAR